MLDAKSAQNHYPARKYRKPGDGRPTQAGYDKNTSCLHHGRTSPQKHLRRKSMGLFVHTRTTRGSEPENENVFIISHKTDMIADRFKNVIKYEKVGNFTKVVE